MAKGILVLLVLAVAVIWYVKTRSPSTENKRSAAKPKLAKPKLAKPKLAKSDSVDSQYHGISIVYDDDKACEAVKALAKQRFLSNEAPSIPVPGCGAASCECKYVHYDDRRTEDADRRLSSSLQSELHSASGQEERRTQPAGRRKTDTDD